MTDDYNLSDKIMYGKIQDSQVKEFIKRIKTWETKYDMVCIPIDVLNELAGDKLI